MLRVCSRAAAGPNIVQLLFSPNEQDDMLIIIIIISIIVVFIWGS